MMTSFERLKAALEHREPDRIPFDLGAAAVAGININSLRALKKYLGLPGEVKLRDRITQIAQIEQDVIDIFKIDVKSVCPKPSRIKGLEQDLGIENGYDRIIDEWGMGWKMPLQGGHYYDLFKSPLAACETIKDVENYP